MLLWAPCAFAKDQVPDWVKQAAAQTLPPYPPRTDAVVLVEEENYSIAADGTKICHVRRVVKILRPQGRKYGELSANFSASEKLRYVHVWSIGPDGHEYAVKDNEQTEFSYGAGFELYSDDKARGATPPAMAPGAVAAIEYERQERPYENDILWMPEDRIPVLRARMTVDLPAGFTYKSSWKGKHTTQPVDQEHGRTLWEMTELPAIRLENVELAPAESSLASRMDVFYYGPTSGPYPAMRGDWKDIGLWYEVIAKDRNKPDAAITAKAQQLVAGKTDFRDRVEAIGDFVQQQIRYVAIEIGIGGNQPHPAPAIFQARYGDCKDKATLLSAMLQAVGIRSTWVLVHTERGFVSGDAPSLAGNHMIAAVELPADYHPRDMYSVVTARSGKRFLIFDPTWEKTPFGDIESNLQGSDALLVDGADSQVIRIPVLPPERNRVERTAAFQLAADGVLTGTVHESLQGDIAADERMLFGHVDEGKQLKYLDRMTARDLVSFELSNVKVVNGDDLSVPLTLDYHLRAEHFGQEAGSLLMVRPRVIGNEGFPVDRAESGRTRKVPIDMGSTRVVHDQCEIELPAGYAVDELPRTMHYDVGFAMYDSKVSVDGRKLHYDRTYTVREIELSPDKYASVEKLSSIIATDEQSTAVLKRTN